jgi:selenide,water dikinase
MNMDFQVAGKMGMEALAVRLTQFSQGGGCGCKVEPETLHALLSNVPKKHSNKSLLVGIENSDDAAVYQINEHQALVFTNDFFAPIVDDPYIYGRVAAANALSDVYAMGGDPLVANAILGYPVGKLSVDTVQEIMRGGTDVCQEAGIPLAGGHTIDNPQPIYGLAAVGMVHPDMIKTNAASRVGDVLIITRPIGIGIMTTAVKTGNLSPAGYVELIENITTLNKVGSWLGKQRGVHAMTDITGFGLAGHLLEMAKGARVRMRIQASAVPVMEEAWSLVVEGVVPTAAYRNMNGYADSLSFDDEWDIDHQLVFTDPQTNGGMLISVAADQADTILAGLRERGCQKVAVIGEVTAYTGTDAPVIFHR